MSNQLAEALRLMVSAFDHGDVMASEGAAIAAAKQAIAAHEAAKPVAYMAKHTDGSVSFAATFAGIYRDTALAIEPLYAAPVPEAAKPEPDLLACDIAPRPLSQTLADYHRAMSEGPLHFTWQDKPHRLVYDLIAAVRYYAAPVAAASPLSLEQIEAMPVWKHFVGLFPETRLEITRAIEAAHGIKEMKP